MKLSKGAAFLFCFFGIIFIFVCMFVISIIKNNLEMIPVAPCLTGVGALATVFIGGSVANNGIKGKNWCQEMYDSENPKGGNT